jgi:hypothetical protein
MIMDTEFVKIRKELVVGYLKICYYLIIRLKRMRTPTKASSFRIAGNVFGDTCTMGVVYSVATTLTCFVEEFLLVIVGANLKFGVYSQHRNRSYMRLRYTAGRDPKG